MTCTLTVDGVVFVLLQELVAKPPYNVSRSRSQYLQDHPEVVKTLMGQLNPLIEALFDLVVFEPVTFADVQEMRQEMLLPVSFPAMQSPLR